MADPVVHITGGIPDSGTGNITTLGQTLLDGANLTLGAMADAAIVAGTTGSISAKLRAISRDLVGGVVLQTGANTIGAVTQSGTWTVGGAVTVSGTVAATQSGAWTVGISGIATVSGTVTANQGGAPWAENQTQLNGVALGSPSVYGTSPGAINVQGVNAFVTNSVAVTGTFWQATQPISGTVTANQGGAWTVAATQSGNWTSRIVGNAGAILDFAGQNAVASSVNAQLIGGQFNTTPTTITSGNASPLQLDSAGNLLVNIKAGAAAGGTSSSFGAAIPGTGTAAGFSDGVNMQLARVFDGDSGAGTQYDLGVLLKTPASGGAVDIGVAGQPLRVDPTGTTTQPVSLASTTITGTVACTQSGNWNMRLQDGSGNAITSDARGTERPLSVQILDASGNQITSFGGSGGTASNFGSTFPTTGTAIGAQYLSSPPALTSGQMNGLLLSSVGRLVVDGSGVTQPISGTITANQGGAPWTIKPDGTAWALTGTSANINLTNASIAVTGTFWQATQPVSAASLPLPSGASTSANQPSNAAIGSTTSGQTGNLAMGAVTTAAPSYTTATTNNLSLTTVGALRVDGSAVTQPVSGTFWQATQPISGTVTANQGSPPWSMKPDGTTWAMTSTSANVNLTNASIAATQSGNWTSRIVGNGGAILDAVIGNATAPANMIAVGGVFNTTKPTLTTGQSAAFQVNSSGIQLVDGSSVTQPVSGTFWQATQPVSIASAVTVQQSTAANLNATVTGTVAATQSGTWTDRIVGNTGGAFDFASTQNIATPAQCILTGGEFNTTPTTITSGNSSPLQLDNAGNLLVNLKSSIVLPASQSGTWTVQPGNTQNTTPWLTRQSQTAASNGLTASRVVAAATTNATSLKTSAGNIAAIDLFNVAAYMVFLKLYNKASAPTVGTDTPVWTVPIPASGGFSIVFNEGEYFSTGIAFAITKLQADTDTTAIAAGDVTGRMKWV